MIDRTSYEPLYRQIQRDIEQQILDGRIAIGDKLMSETEMLQHYGVGRMTVRNALAELVSSGCLRKEQGLGTFCAAMPKQPERKNIHVLLNTGETSFTPYFLSGISRVLDGAKCNLILHDTRDTMEDIARLLDQALERGADGIILQPVTGCDGASDGCKQALERCAAQNIPVITLDGAFENVQTPCVLNDDRLGGQMATKHLLDLGHTKVLGLFRGQYRDAKLRQEGYCDAMERAGLKQHILDADTTEGEALVAYLRKEGITAIVCYNDYLAVKCYHIFDKFGIRAGEELSITGFDDTELSQISLPRITTVTHPKDRMGEKAARYILDRLEELVPEHFCYVYRPDLICRESTHRNTCTL